MVTSLQYFFNINILQTDMISAEDDMHEDEEETLNVVDGPCLIPDIEKYLEQPFEIIYE